MSQPEIQRTERDGVPVLWVPDERTPRLSLVFRSGRVDESLSELGAHHLIEHLVLEALGDVPYEINGRVTPLATVFQAIGDPDDLAHFLVDLCGHLAELPTHHLDEQRRILALEHAEDSGELGASDILLAMRWGATPLGRLAHPEEGLLTLRGDDLRELARRRFVRGAALLCWSGAEPPADLRLPLPAGPNHPLPADLADPDALEAALQQYVPASARQLAIGEGQVPAVEQRAATDLTAKQRKRSGDDLRALAQLLGPDERLERLTEATRGIKSGILAITDSRTVHLFVGDLTTEIAHADLTALRIEHPMTGVRLVVETAGETVTFNGDKRSAEFVALRDLLDELRRA